MQPTVRYADQEHPRKQHSLASAYAQGVGLLLLIEGFWGMFSPVVFGILSTNRLHAAIHIVLGIYGFAAGVERRPSGFLQFLGVLLLAVGVFHFVPGFHDLLLALLNVGTAVAVANIVIGAGALLVRRFH